uniref:Uncharacterized protein n=1 Tax=Arundo donax TaxID=35708 RepID=A0A0A9A4V0_ARUDO
MLVNHWLGKVNEFYTS